MNNRHVGGPIVVLISMCNSPSTKALAE